MWAFFIVNMLVIQPTFNEHKLMKMLNKTQITIFMAFSNSLL